MPTVKSRFIDEDGCQVKVVHLDKVEQARRTRLPEPALDRLSRVFKALGDPNRLKMLIALKDVEMCVCDLAAFTGLSESAVSHQLRQLKDLALVKNRREGQIVYYRLNDRRVMTLLEISLEDAAQ